MSGPNLLWTNNVHINSPELLISEFYVQMQLTVVYLLLHF